MSYQVLMNGDPMHLPSHPTSQLRRRSARCIVSPRSTMVRCRSSAFLHVLCLATAVLCLPAPHRACTQSEKDSLLSFLSNVSSPPDRPLRSWAANTDCCLWEGISCNANGSVTRLWLPDRGLNGTVSPSLDGLSRLAQLNLSNNRLSGMLPLGLLWSDHIVILDVSFNSLSGELSPPASFTNSTWRPIQSLNISNNRFTGELPNWLVGTARELRVLNASRNRFSGMLLPPSICAASPRLNVLDLSHNEFEGVIPRGLGNCSELVVLEAGFNKLSGRLPVDIYGAVQLRRLCLPFNRVTGVLQGEQISNLTNLVVLDLGGNGLGGELPEAIGGLTNLAELHLDGNQLSGTLPSALVNCTNLRRINLRGNLLTGDISAVDFSRLSQLRILDLGDNKFAGEFPASIYSCTSLTALRLANNTLHGPIKPEIQRLQALSYLSLSFNQLEGIGEALQMLKGCKNLTVVLLPGNFNGEAMPDGPDANWTTGAFTNLRVLSLGGCRLSGKIPSWIVRLGKLQVLDLSLNQLVGTIPSWLVSLPRLSYLDMSHNLLSGELPSEITGMEALQSDKAAIPSIDQDYLELPVFRHLVFNSSGLLYNRLSNFPPTLDLRNNSLSGTIPPGISSLKGLHRLDLSSNHLSGEIPAQLCELSNLEMLNLSRNHLSGPIPLVLSRLHFLATFDVSFNNLSGPVPSGGQLDTFPNTSFQGNKDLCGPVLQRPCPVSSKNHHPLAAPGKSHKKKLILVRVIIIVIVIVSVGVSVSIFLVMYEISPRRRNILEATSSDSNSLHHAVASLGAEGSKVVFMFPGDHDMNNPMTVSDVVKATNNFHHDNIVGCGGFGVVYKANLPDGRRLAIKRLTGDTSLMMEREFIAEVEALSRAQHENLVSLKGYYVHGCFRLLIYAYMDNGSLDYWLHERDADEEDGGSTPLDWPTRLRIAQGVSRGLSYIHQVCVPRIVHRDIKSSNILLDQEFKAHLADFGSARLILPNNTHVSTELVGTLGYIPPEYGQARVATLRGDIYSFGVVLLELLTGRRPVDPFFEPKQSGELVVWVQQVVKCQGARDQVLDPVLRGKGFEEEMSRVLDIACHCVSHNPSNRPTTQEVVDGLVNVTTSPTG